MSKISQRPMVVMPTVADDKAITAAAKVGPRRTAFDAKAIAGYGSAAVCARAGRRERHGLRQNYSDTRHPNGGIR